MCNIHIKVANKVLNYKNNIYERNSLLSAIIHCIHCNISIAQKINFDWLIEQCITKFGSQAASKLLANLKPSTEWYLVLLIYCFHWLQAEKFKVSVIILDNWVTGRRKKRQKRDSWCQPDTCCIRLKFIVPRLCTKFGKYALSYDSPSTQYALHAPKELWNMEHNQTSSYCHKTLFLILFNI